MSNTPNTSPGGNAGALTTLPDEVLLTRDVYHPTKQLIDGVIIRDLNEIVDGRGSVIELWSLPWTETDGFVVPKHCYQSMTDFGVIKCWHLHQIHTDQFAVTRGKLQVVLVDIRPQSPTYRKVNSIIVGTNQPRLIKIPPGILHGWKALSRPEVIVNNFQSEPYDPADEFKFRWDLILPEIWEPRNG